jgi:hypothetical protein
MQDTPAIVDSLLATWRQVLDTMPRLFVAVLLLILGLILARMLRRGAVAVARLLRLDTLAERSGVEGFLLRGGVEFTTVTLIGGVVYWIVLFLTFVAMLDMLAVPAGRDLADRLVEFVPNVVVFAVILLFGSVLARVVGSVTFTYLNNIGSRAASAIAVMARLAMLAFVLAMAVEQLALRSQILVSGFQIAFGALCLAMALAFGIGGREWAARILDRFPKV